MARFDTLRNAMTQDTQNPQDVGPSTPLGDTIRDWLNAEWLETVPFLSTVLGITAIVLVAYVADVITRRQLTRLIARVAARTSATWDDHLVRRKVLDRLAHLAPAAVVLYGLPLVPGLSLDVVAFMKSVTAAYMVLTVIRAADAALSSAIDFSRTTPLWEAHPIKGYVQVAKIALYVVGGILIVAALMNRSPLVFLSGIGAMTAVLMLIFKDTILSFVASIQIAMNDLIRVGDWIEMPQFNADGDVIDIALYSVTVQNFDKTVTTIPTYKIMQESLKNWRTMPQSGGRRIKRSLFIDKNSIRFLNPDEVERFKRIKSLRAYIESKQRDLRATNERLGYQDPADINARRLTNVGTFRAYVFEYLRNHSKVNRDLTLLVRQLQPGPHGLPIELYFFTTDTAWADYERVQADIFDHILAMVPEFGLRLYQQPSGVDVRSVGMGLSGGRYAELQPEQKSSP